MSHARRRRLMPPPRPAAVNVVAVIVVAALAGCAEPPPATPPAAAPEARNLVLVTLDTLRADHIGAYGSDVATPRLDAIAAAGALFERASAHVPLTRPSHVSLFAGRLPAETGVRDNVSPATLPADPLLAETLAGNGFETAAFVSSAVVSRASGLDRGFDVYGDRFTASPDDPRFLDSAQKPGDQTVGEAIAWLRERRDDARFFLWLHLFDPHDPYQPPEPYASRYPDRPYAGEVAWTDALVGRLDDALAGLGLDADTLLVVAADHGEGLGEHGELLHGFFAYQSTLRVPLLVRGPGVVAGRRHSELVGLVDLYPTVLALLGVAPPAGVALSGRDLSSTLRGGPPPAPAALYAETLVPRLHFGWSDLRVVRDGDWKYIQAPRPELYDLAADPGETRNVLAENRRRANALRGVLEGLLARERPLGEETAAALPPEQLARLRALGYLGDAAAGDDDPGADPKDKIEAFRLANELMRDGLASLQEGDFAGGLATLERLLAEGVTSAELYRHLGRASLALRRFDDAAGHFLEATRRGPEDPGAWLGLAEARLQRGDAEGALEALRDGAALLPREARLRREEGRLLRLLRRPAEARQAFQAALENDPDDAFVHAALGEALRELGDLEGAVAAQRRAVALAPSSAAYWNALGMTLGGTDQLQDAESAFREATRLAPEHHLYAYNLGLALLRLGRPDQALPHLRRTLTLRPDFQPARDRLAELGVER